MWSEREGGSCLALSLDQEFVLTPENCFKTKEFRISQKSCHLNLWAVLFQMLCKPISLPYLSY